MNVARGNRAAGGVVAWAPPVAPRPFLISGPCVLEDEEGALRIAETLRDAARARGMHFLFKASYLKDNRTSVDAFVGPGLDEGLRILARVRREIGVPILTDVHAVEEVGPTAEVARDMRSPTVTAPSRVRTTTSRDSDSAPANTNSATARRSGFPAARPPTANRSANALPTLAAICVARTAPTRRASSPRRTRPPSIGKAGSRLKPARKPFR